MVVMYKPAVIYWNLLIAVLLLPAVAAGGGEVLGAPSYDHASETTYRAVTWDDFKGKGMPPPGWNRWEKGSFAHITTNMRLSKYEIVEREQDGEWLAAAVGMRPYAIMNKDHSAFKPGMRNAATLDHEQLHFDITEASARRLAVELAELEGRGGSRNAARKDLGQRIQERLDAATQELHELQDRYDRETENGARKKPQRKWAASVPVMFEEATEALVVLIEKRAAADPPPAGGG